MLVLLATAVPTNIGGWGPREGVAAWAFGAAGLGAAQGVATGTVYGLLSLAAISPAVPLLAAAWLRRRRNPGEAMPHEFPTSDPGQSAAAGRSEGGAGG
jgi:hypothetical protein